MKTTLIGLGLLGALALAGCGGGGSTGSVGTRSVAVLVTDSFREDYDQVWATLYKIELIPATGDPVALFDDPTGRQLDLRTLRDATGARFAFLGAGSIPSGTYTGVRVTLGPTLQLVAHGSTTATTTPVDSSIPVDGSGHPQVTVHFAAPRTLGTGDQVVVDFDLAHFVIRAGKVALALKEGDHTGLNDLSRHEHEDYHGTVSGLSGVAPAQTFTLTRGRGMSVTVVTSADTVLFGATPLQDGSIVDVRGRYNTTSAQLEASRIEVRPAGTEPHEGEGHHSPEVEGAPGALVAAAGTFDVAVEEKRGIFVDQTTVHIATTSATRYRTGAGVAATKEAFFTALAGATSVEVEGVYDVASNTLTASKAVLGHGDGPGDDNGHHGGDDSGHHD